MATCDAAEPPAASAPPAALLTTVSPMRPVQAAVGEAISAQATLREMLPDSAYAYARIPNAWGLIGTPTGGSRDRAVGSAPYAAAVRSVREGLAATVTPELPEDLQPMARLFLEHATSPIEAAALAPPPQSPAPLPGLLLTAQVDFPDVESLNTFLAEVAKQHPELRVVEPVRADAPGMVAIGKLAAQIQLDGGQSRLYVATGIAPTPTMLADMRSQLRPNASHRMFPLEAGIDESGQGLFLWLNPPKLVELATAMGGPEQGAMLASIGAGAIQGFGVGMGTSGGIHRLKAVLDMPREGFRAFLPVIQDLPSVQAAGEPGMVFVLGLPSPDDLAAIEGVAMIGSPEDAQKYQAFKQEFAQKLGFSIEDILASLGQDLTILSDEAGQYMAVRLKDAQRFHQIIDALSQRFGVRHEVREIGGRTYHHLVVPSLGASAEAEAETATKAEPGPETASETASEARGDAALEGPGARLFKRVLQVPTHLYWVEEGDHLLLAGQPQVLIDRNYIAARTPIDQWLRSQQRMGPEGALLLASARTPGLPAMIYRFSLEFLSFLGDVVERPVDLFELPTAREAGIPDQGAYGLKLTSTDTRLAFELAFENNPLEILFMGNSYTGVAMIGVVAAIAIPAYADYTVRAKVGAGIATAEGVRILVAEFMQSQGHYPTAAEIEGMDLSPFESEQYDLTISPDDGRIILEFHFDPIEGETVELTPEMQDDGLNWACAGTMNEKLLPPSCR